jgi:trk system potassium uptake protein TrkH
MLNKSFFFSFQSIFIFFAFLTFLSLVSGYFLGLDGSLVFLVTLLFNILIVYLINFINQNFKINRVNFIYLSIIGWFLIILIGAIPFFEILENTSFNEIIFFSTSLATTTGFNINLNDISDDYMLSLWASIIQIIGAIYTLLLFIIYSSLFFKKYTVAISKKNIIRFYIVFLSFLFLYIIIFILSNNSFISSISLASSLLTSTGLKISNSVFLNHDANHLLIIILMLAALLILPLFFMVISKNSFKLLYGLLNKNKSNLLFFILLIFIFSMLLESNNLTVLKKFCLTVSLITTTGVLPNDFEDLEAILLFKKFLFFFVAITLIGTFSGTINGGIKLNKISLFFVNLKEELNKFLYLNNVKGVGIIKRGFSKEELSSFYAVTVLFFIFFILSLLFLNFMGIDQKVSFIYIIASLTNSGEALLILGNITEKITPNYYFILNILMICGRFEFIGYFLIFNRVLKFR